jgi:uncharacterized coiled-coil protein SlyX
MEKCKNTSPGSNVMIGNQTADNSATTDSESVNINQLVSRVERLEQKVDEQQSTIDEQQSTIQNQQETIDEQQNEIDELRDELTEHQETINDQQSTIQNQQETIDEQQNEIDELRSELIEHQERSVRKIAETMKDVNQLQESLEGDSNGITPTPTDGRTTIQEQNLKPIEQISRADNENLDEVIDSPSVRRAVSLFKNIADWGSQTPKGIVLKSSDNPLSLLSADMDESLCWKQYYRAAEALESLSEGALTFFNSKKHGKMLVLHQKSEVYDRMKNGALTMSSAGTTV